MNGNNYFNDFFKDCNYTDDFGYNPVWNEEIDKWLEIAHKINKNYYKIGKTDIRTREKRDAFLGEIKSIYYCYNFLGGKEFRIGIKELIDFEYQKDGKNFFVEVKSPSWQGEVFKDDKLSKKQKLIRKNGEQYINGECKWFSVKSVIEDSIKNSIHKFKKDNNNILMIAPNMNYPLNYLRRCEIEKVIKEEIEKQDKKKLISTISILEAELRQRKISYLYKEYQIKA